MKEGQGAVLSMSMQSRRRQVVGLQQRTWKVPEWVPMSFSCLCLLAAGVLLLLIVVYEVSLAWMLVVFELSDRRRGKRIMGEGKKARRSAFDDLC